MVETGDWECPVPKPHAEGKLFLNYTCDGHELGRYKTSITPKTTNIVKTYPIVSCLAVDVSYYISLYSRPWSEGSM